jgi:hypothetical protein
MDVEKIRRRREASRQIPALAKLEEAPKMKAVWRQGATDVIFHNGNWAQVRTEASEGT